MHLITDFERKRKKCEALLALADTAGFRLVQSVPGFPVANIAKQYCELLRQTRDDYEKAIEHIQRLQSIIHVQGTPLHS
jgi:hypothetical protein